MIPISIAKKIGHGSIPIGLAGKMQTACFRNIPYSRLSIGKLCGFGISVGGITVTLLLFDRTLNCPLPSTQNTGYLAVYGLIMER